MQKFSYIVTKEADEFKRKNRKFFVWLTKESTKLLKFISESLELAITIIAVDIVISVEMNSIENFYFRKEKIFIETFEKPAKNFKYNII